HRSAAPSHGLLRPRVGAARGARPGCSIAGAGAGNDGRSHARCGARAAGSCWEPLMQIADRQIGGAAPPFVIAEMSGNHNGSLEQALRIVDAAAQAGAHALKIQTYTA